MEVDVKGLATDPSVQSIAAGLPPRCSRTRSRATAYHEAGHAIVAFVCGIPIRAISITGGKGFDGYVQRRTSKLEGRVSFDRSDRVRLTVERFARFGLAGGIAQRRYSPRSWRHYHGQEDSEHVADLVFSLCGSEDEADAWIKLLTIQTNQIVEIWWETISALAEHLLVVHSMTGVEFRQWHSQYVRRSFAGLTGAK